MTNREPGSGEESLVASLRSARDRLERAQEIAQIGDSVYFPKSKRRVWSEQTFRLYGFEPRNEPPSERQILNAIYPKDLQANRAAIEETLFGSNPTSELQYRVLHKDGSIHWIRVVSLREEQSPNSEERVFSTIQNITEQKATEEEMLLAIERQRELVQMKSDFLNMISHEYRTPLGIINSSADILARYHDRLLKEDRLNRIADIKQSARRLADLVEEVLFLGKSDSGKMQLQNRPVDLESLIREITEAIVTQFGFPRVVNIECETLTEECKSDEQLLRHILNNTISNALKYSTLDKSVDIKLGPQNGGVRIAVKDYGIGIPKEEQPKLFSMFHRASNVGTISGTGLGLVILKRCIDHLRGKVSLDSEPGKGTEVAIWLPATIEA